MESHLDMEYCMMKKGKKEYEGFMVNGVKMGYGIEYYSDIGLSLIHI